MSIGWPMSWFDEPRLGSVRTADTAAPARAFGGVRTDVPMSQLTTFQVGGPAHLLLEPLDPQSAAETVRRVRQRGLPVRVLGNGSNLLVSDAGVEGAVIFTDRMRRCIQDEDRIRAWAGTHLVGLVNYAAKVGLSGVEGLIGIPAQVGGAVRMNAGGRWGEIFDVLESVTVCDLETGDVRTLSRAECQPTYRNSNLGNQMILECVLRLKPGDRKAIAEATKEHLLEKNAVQPVTEPSAGCIFKNPKPDSAGKVIESCGLKGTRIGGIEVSPKHANYFVNVGGGTCDDALRLIELVRDRVRRERGIELQLEVQLW